MENKTPVGATNEKPMIPESAGKGTGGPVIKSEKEDLTSASFKLPKALYKKLKILCIETEKDQSRILTEALEKHLAAA